MASENPNSNIKTLSAKYNVMLHSSFLHFFIYHKIKIKDVRCSFYLFNVEVKEEIKA